MSVAAVCRYVAVILSFFLSVIMGLERLSLRLPVGGGGMQWRDGVCQDATAQSGVCVHTGV